MSGDLVGLASPTKTKSTMTALGTPASTKATTLSLWQRGLLNGLRRRPLSHFQPIRSNGGVYDAFNRRV